ncbi:conserved hypothetical protein [Ricinus communis]|uniref:Uncharacterized protein n=1 Tax=Ricinus communis TaxID=3988 RepID=B9SMC3_RICCO|nr:conserved hypothetical protein [Ricinus communis]
MEFSTPCGLHRQAAAASAYAMSPSARAACLPRLAAPPRLASSLLVPLLHTSRVTSTVVVHDS